jgi:hypothetical protein
MLTHPMSRGLGCQHHQLSWTLALELDASGHQTLMLGCLVVHCLLPRGASPNRIGCEQLW